MSGHNKWSKIKHKKAASDANRSRVFSKHSNLITMESRKAGGDVNSPGLAAAVLRAKQDSMPKENIDRAVAKGAGTDAINLTEVVFEAFGPGGAAFIITAVTDNNNRTSQEIKHVFNRLGYELGAPGSAAWAFNRTPTGYSPTAPIMIDPAAGEKLVELIEAINEQADVQEIFTTASEFTPAS